MPPRDLRHELNQDTSRYPQAWSPQPGATMVGRLLRMTSRRTKYGEQNVALVESEEDGQTYSVFLSRVLQSLFDEQDVRPLDRLGIKYIGRNETKGYHMWSLVCEKEELPPARPAAPASMRTQSRPYANATMGMKPSSRTAPAPVVSRGPADADVNDPFNN